MSEETTIKANALTKNYSGLSNNITSLVEVENILQE